MAPGERVATPVDGDTLAELTHRNGAVTRLDRATEVVVHEPTDEDGRLRVVVALGPGRTWHHTGPFDDPALYEARTPSGTVTARGAVFVVTCGTDGSSHVRVVRGTAVVRGALSGSVVVLDGQAVDIAAIGMLGVVRPEPVTGELAEWIQLNALIESGEAAADADPAPIDTSGAGAAPPRPLPRWVVRAAGIGVALAFVALLAITFLAARNSDHTAAKTALPAPAPSTTTLAPPAPAAPPTTTMAPPTTTLATATTLAPPTATATGTACTQKGGTITYSGTLVNTGGRTSGFVVTARFTTGKGERFATGSATVAPVAPGRSASWSVAVASSTDLRGSGASCDVAGVRPA
ncbi:MAG TPA: hypothetical protein VFA94_12280 [Acidimicrobiales bacterium]|nr:hypothetical protein [Acidimicrobiales bacterium]